MFKMILNLEDMTSRLERILDVKYEPADLDDVVENQADESLSDDEADGNFDA